MKQKVILEALRVKTRRYSEPEKELIERAFYFAEKAHENQKRQSGEKYIVHPVAVACLIADMQLDASSVITGLLHDTVEDTEVTLSDIAKSFGDEVAHLVAGVTKLSQIELKSGRSKQAENFRKLVLAMSDDIRVLLVKLLDRLHNMRTLYHMRSEQSRRRIAIETMEIYAPLAERIGLKNLQDDLQNLAFAELHRDAYHSIQKRLIQFEEEGGETEITQVIEDVSKNLREAGVHSEVSGRRKTPYSIWKKMHRKSITFEQLSDVMAFRVIVDSVADCYQALGVIHNHYLVIPGRFKDYISTPKPNHYQSLHTTVITSGQRRIEIQIRTEEMHQIAEYGVAAHWEYKQGVKVKEGRQYHWLKVLLEILENATNPDEFLEHTKLEMFQHQVFCFSPKGDLIALPKGATCIDFAYAVHSDVGNKCTGAKVNGRLVPLRTELGNGDQVEIITSDSHEPSPTWERFVVTGKARANIRRYIRSKQISEFKELGEAILKKAFQRQKIPYKAKDLKRAFEYFKYNNLQELFIALGRGDLTGADVVNHLHPKEEVPAEQEENFSLPKKSPVSKKRDQITSGSESVAIKGLIPGMAIHYAACCHPLPGDRIVGVVVSGKGVTIHTWDCENLQQFQHTPERLLDVSWEGQGAEQDIHIGRLFMILANVPGALGKVSIMIGNAGGNIVNLKIIRRSDDFFELFIDISVQNVEHLQAIIASLRTSTIVSHVERK